jgi:hypothetical protein
VVALAACAPAMALADKTWKTGIVAGNWNAAGNWVEGGVPGSADNVFILAADANDRSVTLDVSSSVKELRIGNTGAGTYSLEQSGPFALTTDSEVIGSGVGGHAVHVQSAGTNSSGWLRVGEALGSTGTYFLSGNATLTVSGSFEESIGDAGTGSFVQTGGVNQTDYFSMGASGGTGSYSLSAGAWHVVHEEYLYNGSVVHTGGTHTVDNLYVGAGGGLGSYSLSASGILNVTGDENVSGEGAFVQSGGTHTIGSTLTLADYTLTGSGALNVAISTDMFSFTQTGGTHTTGGLTIVDQYKLSGSGSLHVTGDENLGIIPDTTGTFTQSGGTHRIDGTMFVGSATGAAGKVMLSGGSVIAGATKIATGSTLNQTGGTFEPGDLRIEPGGTLVVASDGNRTLRVQSLSIDGASVLDLNDNDLVIRNGNFSEIQQLVLAGYSASPDSTKTGIVSTSGQNSEGITILAVFDNALAGIGEWPFGSGQSLDATAVVGKYTYFGDTNMDGQVTPQDYGAVDSNLGSFGLDMGIAWFLGDTNFDGNVTAQDYAGIDSSLGLGMGNPLGAGSFSTGTVPEPGGMMVCLGIGCVMRNLNIRRRRIAASGMSQGG